MTISVLDAQLEDLRHYTYRARLDKKIYHGYSGAYHLELHLKMAVCSLTLQESAPLMTVLVDLRVLGHVRTEWHEAALDLWADAGRNHYCIQTEITTVHRSERGWRIRPFPTMMR